MTVFFLRLFVFVTLWGWLIVQDSTQKSLSLLFFAVVLGLYFLLSLHKSHPLIYYALSVLIIVHGYAMTETGLLTILIVMCVVSMAAFRFVERTFYTYALSNAVLLTVFVLLQETGEVELIAAGLVLLFLSIWINHLARERIVQRDLYEGLLSEYKRLKRMSLASDRSARLEERTRIARDIHDSVGHRLSSLIIKLESLAIQENNPEYRSLKEMAEAGLKDTRKAVKTLQNEEAEGINTVIHLIRKLEAESHIVIQFTIQEGVLSVPLSNEKSVVLYRVLQEALTNVMRHGQTREVRMVLGQTAIGHVSFKVSNTYHADKRVEYGFGLRNMSARLQELGGELHAHQTENEFILSGMIPAGED